MVFFSTYKVQRVLARDFLKPQVMAHRAWMEWLLYRPWMAALNNILLGDARYFLAIAFTCYYMARINIWKTTVEDEYQRVLINRHGGSVEAVRKNLSPADQARARAYIQYEQYVGSIGSKENYFRPEGHPLPSSADFPESHGHH